MAVYRDEPVIETLRARGERLRAGVQEIVAAHGIGHAFGVAGHPACLYFWTANAAGEQSQDFRTLFLQECIGRGLLASSFVISYAHGEDDVDLTLEIVDEALASTPTRSRDPWIAFSEDGL